MCSLKKSENFKEMVYRFLPKLLKKKLSTNWTGYDTFKNGNISVTASLINEHKKDICKDLNKLWKNNVSIFNKLTFDKYLIK